jgi:VanZ family protein
MFRPPPSTLRPLFTHWLPLIVYGLFITLQSHYPTPEVVPRWQGLDKLLHVGAYALLGLLFCRAYHSRWPAAAERSLARAGAASAAIFGLFDEIHQHFTPFRSADPLDVLADALGGALGVLAFHFLLELVRPRPPASA